ncbi:MAG: DUF4272 domain-containing protein [Archangium sp.]|nr:DUF4272 domain-containing protein [Archangium sp.]
MATSRKPLFDPDEKTATEGKPAESAPEESDADAPLTAPPEPDVVAGRALMVAALLERARLESTRDEARFTALQAWVDELGLFGNLGPDGVELFESKLGSWSDEDIESVDWTSEELLMLSWALGKSDLPTLEARADAAGLVAKLPLLGPAESFIDDATLRPLDELEVHRALCEALLEAIRSEVYARTIQEDPASLEPDEDLEELLSSVAAEGFDRKAAAAKGPAHEAVQGLRYWSRTLLNELFASGSPHEAHRIDSAKLVSLDEATLATWLGVAHSRTEAMAWLLEGDEYETE